MSHPTSHIIAIDLGPTTETLSRAHRALMDRRSTPDMQALRPENFSPELVEDARHQWAARASAEYQSTAQFAQLIHRLCLASAPIELIGAATRLVTDECRHAELCARIADRLGGRDAHDVEPEGMSLFTQSDHEPLFAAYMTILAVCCFGEQLSVPMLDALATVATDPTCRAVAQIIAADEGYHARFGWEALATLAPRLSAAQHERVQRALPGHFAHFEHICQGSPALLKKLADSSITIEPGDAAQQPNLGTLTSLEYATIFYHTVEEAIFPQLAILGYDPHSAWASRA